jgi:hypothetical protein
MGGGTDGGMGSGKGMRRPLTGGGQARTPAATLDRLRLSSPVGWDSSGLVGPTYSKAPCPIQGRRGAPQTQTPQHRRSRRSPGFATMGRFKVP